MKRDRVKELIKDYLRAEYPRVVHKGTTVKEAVIDWGYENENCGRSLRELENDKIVEVIYNEKREAMYRYIPGSEIDIPVVEEISDRNIMYCEKEPVRPAVERKQQAQMFEVYQRY